MRKPVKKNPAPKQDRTSEPTSGQVEQSVGEAIRKLRSDLRLSVRTLASKCGFSASFISQVELGQASPSIASLNRIASGLGVTLGQFFLSSQPTEPAVVKASQRPMLQSEWSRSQIESLGSHSAGSNLKALMVTLRPGGASGGSLHVRETALFAFVFTGTVALQLGETAHMLRRGDAITIPAGTPHRWENKSATGVQLLKVIAR